MQSKLKPENLKSRARKATLSIILFVLTYILILIASLGLITLSLFLAFKIVDMHFSLITLAAAFGVVGMSFFVLYFVIKFMFNTKKTDYSGLIEVQPNDEPELFELIHNVAKGLKTRFPKKVFLAYDVNASAAYDLSFWSLFFPVRKNLTLGLGLINSSSISELEGIIAHELGHFSQNTMVIGSYTHYTNQLIYNMLYENETFDKLVEKWREASSYLSVFGEFALKITQGIQWILRQLYGLVNKYYLSLSREMEFQADAIAARQCGTTPIIESLLRQNLASHAFQSAMSFYAQQSEGNIKSQNIYTDQSFIMNLLAQKDNLPLKKNLPIVSSDFFKRFNKSRIVFENQWKSHPSILERVESLKNESTTEKECLYDSAMLIFKDPLKLQKEFSQLLFSDFEMGDQATFLSPNDFATAFTNDLELNSFPKIFNNYYDDKNPIYNEISNVTIQDVLPFEALFSNEIIELIYTSLGLQNDIAFLDQVSNNQIRIKTFDYDGKRYHKKQSQSIADCLKKELHSIKQKIATNDKHIFEYFNQIERSLGTEERLSHLYHAFFHYEKELETKNELYYKISESLEFVNVNTSFEDIKSNFRKVSKLEIELKQHLKEMLQNPYFSPILDTEDINTLQSFITKELDYFGVSIYNDENLEKLFFAINSFAFLCSKGHFLIKKKLLNYQEELYNKSKE